MITIKTIWKYEVELTDLMIIDMPKGAEILTVQVQRGRPYIWALVTGEQKDNVSAMQSPEKERRYFELFGTGHPITMDINRHYVGTFQMSDGSLVFHLFEIIK